MQQLQHIDAKPRAMRRGMSPRVWLKRERTRLKLRRRGSFVTSTLVSLLVRPWLERDFVKAFLGIPLFAVVTYTGVNSLPTTEEAYGGWESNEPIATVLAYNQALPHDGDTVTYLLPVAVLNGVSQSYHAGHPGIDLMSPLGSGVLAMERGTVESVTFDKFGYGRHVYVTHLYGVKSLYAHLQEVWVAPGQEVVPGQPIGTIGLTGWSTGPHLHFEVMEEDKTVNPMRYIGDGIEWAREQAEVNRHEGR